MPDWKSLLSNPKHLAVVAVIAVATVAGVALAVAKMKEPEVPAPEAAPLPPGPAIPPPTAGSGGAPAPGAVTAVAGAPAPPPEPPKATARITFSTVPSVQATVTWGRQRLGVIRPRAPLVITRPRDSGPLDVVIKANGYLPVSTRAHTFGDTRVTVKLTPPEEQHTLLGYRAPLDAGLDSGFPPYAGSPAEGLVTPIP